MVSKRLLIRIDAADQETLNADAQTWDPTANFDTFTRELSPTGTDPVTHYVCSVQMEPAVYDAVSAFLATYHPTAIVVEYTLTNPTGLSDILTSWGLQFIERSI